MFRHTIFRERRWCPGKVATLTAPDQDQARASVTCLVLSHTESVFMLFSQVILSHQRKEKVCLFSRLPVSIPLPSTLGRHTCLLGHDRVLENSLHKYPFISAHSILRNLAERHPEDKQVEPSRQRQRCVE